ncbi:M50 family metallopeptidase [Candidatus Woesearchaeota archaeon]|nr:M50 family metallopeptidase [Candidatus Woesearchaeota archaeon]
MISTFTASGAAAVESEIPDRAPKATKLKYTDKKEDLMFAVQELIDVIVMSVGVGFIFQDVIRVPSTPKTYSYDPLARYSPGSVTRGFFQSDLWFAILVTAPAIIFHELMHKLVALVYGLQATFHAAYFWLGIGVVLKLIGFPFIFFVPGYVSISGVAVPLQNALIAFAGPGTNLLLFGVSWFLLKNRSFLRRYRRCVPILHV